MSANKKQASGLPGPGYRNAQGIIVDVRDSGVRSARWTLLMLLGEYVKRQPVWSATLLRAMSLLGFEEAASRQAIHRLAKAGLIEKTKIARSVRWSVTPAGLDFLESGRRRVLEFTGVTDLWDGNWFSLAISVPDSEKNARYALRRKLTWLGLGSALPGQWITPHVDRAAEVATVVSDLGLSLGAYSFVGRFDLVGDEAEMVESAWDLNDLGARYYSFIERFHDQQPSTNEEEFLKHIELLHTWRRFPFIDPVLPKQLLPEDWVGTNAVQLFERLYTGWLNGAHDYWDTLSSPSIEALPLR